jgi:hypothetical protein
MDSFLASRDMDLLAAASLLQVVAARLCACFPCLGGCLWLRDPGGCSRFGNPRSPHCLSTPCLRCDIHGHLRVKRKTTHAAADTRTGQAHAEYKEGRRPELLPPGMALNATHKAKPHREHQHEPSNAETSFTGGSSKHLRSRAGTTRAMGPDQRPPGQRADPSDTGRRCRWKGQRSATHTCTDTCPALYIGIFSSGRGLVYAASSRKSAVSTTSMEQLGNACYGNVQGHIECLWEGPVGRESALRYLSTN